MFAILILLQFENKLGVVISHINCISKHLNKYKCALKLIHLITMFTLFPLQDVQQCQIWQLCVFRENSSGKTQFVPVSLIVAMGRTKGQHNPVVRYLYNFPPITEEWLPF